MTLNNVIRFAILDFTIFLKPQEITEINPKSSQNAYVMYKFANFCNLRKLKKKIQNYVKKVIFGQTYLKLTVSLATPKMIGIQLTYQNFCDR